MVKNLVSVVIPTYNRAEHILDAVETVRNQTYPDIEIVVVIDGSQDNTLSLLQSYKDNLPEEEQETLQIIYQDNAGVSSARNNGIAHAQGDFIALLDDDDNWQPEKIAKQVEISRQYTSNKPFLCTTDYFELENGQSTPIECRDCMTLEGQYERGMFPPPSTWLFSREAYEIAGGFDEQMNAGEDLSFLFWLRRNEVPFVNIDEPMATYDFPPPSKTYENQVGAHAKGLSTHGAWLSSQLSAGDFAKTLGWYEEVLPEDMYERAISGLDISEPNGSN